MKTDWERTTPVLLPPLAAVEALVGRRIHAIEPLSGGLANTNLRLRTEPADLVLRLYQRDPAAQAKEVALARQLAGVVPVAQVLASGADEGVGAPWLLMPWIEGVSMDTLAGDAPALARAAESAGRVLAAIAAQPGTLVEQDGPRLSTDAFRGWLDGVLSAARLPEELAARVRRFAQAWAPLLDERSGERGLVHCDYNGANLLIRNGEVAAVLDWEFAMAGTPLWDLANMVRHYAAQGPDVARIFARGFEQAGGRLPDRWREQAALLDVVNLADMLSKSAPGSGRARSMARSIETHLGDQP